LIISASYRTDIPAFYGEWFMARLREGHCKVSNPYNGTENRVPLGRDDVDGFVFWTKNLGPFLPHLEEIDALGYPFIIQHTINGYPRELEGRVVDWRDSVEQAHAVAERYGPRTVVWRYDPIVVTNTMTLEQHITRFNAMARALEGAVDEVVVSFAQMYQKTTTNMNRAAAEQGFRWFDPSDWSKRELVSDLVQVAAERRMQLSVCSQKKYAVGGAQEAACVDAYRLSDVAGYPIKAKRKGNREGCCCFESRDIGAYNSCPHGCIYCYAVEDHARAEKAYEAREDKGEILVGAGVTGRNEQIRGG